MAFQRVLAMSGAARWKEEEFNHYHEDDLAAMAAMDTLLSDEESIQSSLDDLWQGEYIDQDPLAVTDAVPSEQTVQSWLDDLPVECIPDPNSSSESPASNSAPE